MRQKHLPFLFLLGGGLFASGSATALPFFFSTGNPDGRMATVSRPDSPGKMETESADDFVLGSTTSITSASFTGLITNAGTATIGEVRVEIYRVFPADSNIARTPAVPTRVNSPSDVEFTDRDTATGNLNFSVTTLSASFTANNSVQNGINKIPNQRTGGEGSVTGQEARFDITFTTPILLPADHYFFVPQVQVDGGEFYWLSAPRPIVPPGTPFPPSSADLQSWIRNQSLDPDWLRVGTDIIGGTPAPTFNAVFSLDGTTVPEPSTLALLGGGFVLLPRFRKRR